MSVPDVGPEALWLLWRLPRHIALYVPELEAVGLRRGALGSTLTDVRLAYAFAESPLLPTLELWSLWRCVRIERGRGGRGPAGELAPPLEARPGGTVGEASETRTDVGELGTASSQVEPNGEVAEDVTKGGVAGESAAGKRGKKKKKKKKRSEDAKCAGDASAFPHAAALPAGSFAMAFEPVAGAPLSLSVIAVPAPPAGDASADALFLGERSPLSPEEATRVVERAVDWRGAAWEEREKRRERDRRRNEERRARRAVEGERGDQGRVSSPAGSSTDHTRSPAGCASSPSPDASRAPPRSVDGHAPRDASSSPPPASRGSLLTLRLSYFVPKHLAEVVGAAGIYADVDGRLEAVARRCRDDALATRREVGGDCLASLRAERDAWREEATRAMQRAAGPA